MPCPADWFEDFSLNVKAAEILNCPVPEVDKYPYSWKLKALKFAQVQDEAGPKMEEYKAGREAGRKEAEMLLANKNRHR